jgi:hypothetical protein
MSHPQKHGRHACRDSIRANASANVTTDLFHELYDYGSMDWEMWRD